MSEHRCRACLGVSRSGEAYHTYWPSCQLPNGHDGPHIRDDGQYRWEWTDEHPHADRLVGTGPSWDPMPCH